MTDPARIAALRSHITKAKQAYYFGGQPIISDDAYDALENELARLSPKDPLLSTVGAPVPPDSILEKAEHSIPMGSQAKVNTEAELRVWFEKSVSPENPRVQASLKGDGASAAAYYEDGVLRRVISRGDGRVGEDITANALKFSGLPTHVVDGFCGAVRFEVILTVENWGIVDPSRSKNPRNAGAGIMGRKNGTRSELLSVFAFDLDDQTPGADPLKTEMDKAARLEVLGFQRMPFECCTTVEDVVKYFDRIKEERAELPFWIDGVVIKIDDLAHQSALGMTGGRPKGQVAWKFQSEGAPSVLLSYTISGGHTGSLLPNAQFEPVNIGGTTVSNALLANWEEIERLDVAVGDEIWVVKANDIIPKIIEVRARPANRIPIIEPTTCPFCEGAVGRRGTTKGEAGAITQCLNADCPQKTLGRLKRWIKSVGIDGIGDSVRSAMVEQLGIIDAGYLYGLHERLDALMALRINQEKQLMLGEKRARSIIESIESKRQLDLVVFVGSLGVAHLGKRRAELMVRTAMGELSTLNDWRGGKLRNAAFAERVGVPNVAENIANSLDAMGDTIDSLLHHGVVVLPPQCDAEASSTEEPGTAILTVCITGRLPSGKKKADYAGPLAAAGMKLQDTVSADLRYLVLADPNVQSAKAKKARKFGVKLISEDELQGLISSASTFDLASKSP